MNTEQETNKTIAQFCGYYVIQPPEEDGTSGYALRGVDNIYYEWHDTPEEAWADAPDYFNTDQFDPLKLVLNKLNDEQWNIFVSKLQAHYNNYNNTCKEPVNIVKFILTLPSSVITENLACVMRFYL